MFLLAPVMFSKVSYAHNTPKRNVPVVRICLRWSSKEKSNPPLRVRIAKKFKKAARPGRGIHFRVETCQPAVTAT